MSDLSDLYKPKYLQLYEIIKKEINLGKYKQGAKLPSEAELIKRFNVSSITVRKCVDILKNEGLIERVQGLGTFVKNGNVTEYSAKGFVFGICLQNSTNEWNSEVLKGIKSVIESAGGRIFTTDALGDREKEVEDLISVISKKPDLIYILACDQQIMKRGNDIIEKNEIPIISLESYIEGPNIRSHLFADQMINGIFNANNIIDYLATKREGRIEGNLAVLYTQGLSTLDLRYKAMLLKLNEYSGIKILDTLQYDLKNPLEESQAASVSFLKKYTDKIDVITALHGETIVGVTRAIDELGLNNDIKVIGIDAFNPVIDLMKQGKPIIASVQQDGYAMGTVAAKVGMKVLAGEAVSYQYILPLINIYADFPNRADNYPKQGRVKISCPHHLKESGFDWGY
jgi:ABC-type sugar transport system substrate-binding protein